MRAGILQSGIVIAVFMVALVFGRHALATTFRTYDDEGYLLLSLGRYLAGGHLYTEVFSQYGPFHFFAESVMFQLLRLPVNHDAGRLVTLICWLLSAALGGYFVYRLSSNTLLASAAGLATMALAGVLANEPGHPQQVILPLLIAACCASLTRGRIGLLLLGALGSALLFTKVNVGVFYFAALAFALVCGFPAGRSRTIGGAFLLVYAVAGPLFLMRQDLLTWAGAYCLLAILCGVSTFLVGLLTMPSSPRPMRSLLYAIAGAVSTAALVVLETMRQGMSLSTLLEGVIWAPLRHPRVFELPMGVSKRAILIAVPASACIAGLYWFRDRWRAHAESVDALRCMTGLGAIALLTTNHSPASIVALLPLALIRAKDAWRPSDTFPRLFVAGLAATQFLMAYPVAGSQRNIAFAPLLLWAFICVHDGASGLFSLVRRPVAWLSEALPKESILGGLVALALAVAMFRSSAWSERRQTHASSLRGAASLYLPADMEDRYRFLASNISPNCDVLFTLPGMGSLNFWSDVPTPNGLNLTAWMKGFSPEQQQQILRILETNPRACVVYNEALARLWGMVPEDLVAVGLPRYIVNVMPKVSQIDGYEIRVHPQRNSPWIEAAPQSAP